MSAFKAVIAQITDSNHQAVLQQGPTNNIVTHLRKVEQVNPYFFDAEQTCYLESCGIESSPYAIERHQHPISKAFENRCLDSVGYMLGDSYSVVFMKEKKLTRLHPKKGADVELINAHITPKDHIRYQDHLVRQPLAAITKARAFVHDALHYYSLEAVYECLLVCPQLQDIFASVVIPPEVEYGLRSIAPIAYNLRYHQRDGSTTFTYIPDQHEAGAYEQPLSCLQWLKVGRFVGPQFTFTITKLETWGAHHLLQISRGDSIIPMYNYFPRTHLVRLPNIYSEVLQLKNPFISKLLMKKLIMYAWSLKEVSYRDVRAKLRQVIPNTMLEDVDLPVLIAAVDFVVVYSKLDSKPELESVLGNTLMDWFRLSFQLDWLEFKRKYWPMVKDSFQAALSLGELPDFEFEFEQQTVHYNSVERMANVHFFQTLDVQSYQFQRKCTVTRKHFERPPQAQVAHLASNNGFRALRTAPDPTLEEDQAVARLSFAPDTDVTDPTPFYARNYKLKLKLPEWQSKVLAAMDLHLTLIQRDPEGKVIMPLIPNLQVNKQLNCPWPNITGRAAEEFLSRIRPKVKAAWRHWRWLDCTRERAKPYSSDNKNRRDGTLASQKGFDVVKFDEVVTSRAVTRRLPVLVFSGRGGSGKSQIMQAAFKNLKDSFGEVQVVVPTQNLRTDWLEKCDPEFDAQVKTYEKAIMEQAARVVILDDAGKLPRGYIAAFARFHIEVEAIIVTLDSRQSVYHAQHRESLQRGISSEVEWLAPLCDYDLNFTYRNAVNIANALGVYSLNGTNALVRLTSTLRTSIPTLTPSTAETSTLNENEHSCYSYAGCQGLTFGTVQINLTKNTPYCSDNTLYTALSRPRSELIFVNSFSESPAFLSKLNKTPYLKTFLKMVTENRVLELPPTEDPPQPEPTVRTHIAVETAEEVYGEKLDDMADKHEREMFDPKLGHSNTVQGQTLIEQAFPRQQAKDEVLAAQTIEHRIHPCDPEDNEQRFRSSVKISCGQLLAENYFEAMCFPEEDLPFDADLWEQCELEWDANFLAKTEAQIANGALRQDPDFDDLDLDAYLELGHALEKMGMSNSRLFIKSQEVLKLAKMAKDQNKPGQSILALKQTFIQITGVMTRYQDKLTEKYMPAEIFINARKTPEQLNAFVLGTDGTQPWDFSHDSYASDITEFDDQQEEGTLHFEELKARRLGVPAALIKFRIYAKLHPKCFKGCYKVKRTTGESETFSGNTDYMIALDSTMFIIPKGTKRVHGGDDMIRNKVCKLKQSWLLIAHLFRLKIKPEVGKFLDFCSWLFSHHGILKDPIKLEASLAYKEARGPNDYLPALRSYFDSYLFAYKMGDALFEVLDSRQMAAHQLLTRRFVKAGFTPHAVGDAMYPGQGWLKAKKQVEVLESLESRYAIGHRMVEEDAHAVEARLTRHRPRLALDVATGPAAAAGRRARKSLRYRLNKQSAKTSASVSTLPIHHDDEFSELPDTHFDGVRKTDIAGGSRL